MSDKDLKNQARPESYPRPTETDEQLRNQPEYIDEQPNVFSDKTVSDIPVGSTPPTTKESEQMRKTDDGRVE